jgi:hypothetical protein
MALDLIDGGDGTPPEPNWRAIFGRAADRAAAAEHWKSIVAEIRTAEKLSAANGHAILRLVVAYMTFDRSAKEVMKAGPVTKAPRTKVPTYNPWWTGALFGICFARKPTLFGHSWSGGAPFSCPISRYRTGRWKPQKSAIVQPGSAGP